MADKQLDLDNDYEDDGVAVEGRRGNAERNCYCCCYYKFRKLGLQALKG